MNATTAALLPLSTRALASIHVLATAATTAAISSGGWPHSMFGDAAAAAGDGGVCHYPNPKNWNPTTALLLSSSHSSSSQHQQQQSQYQHQYQDSSYSQQHAYSYGGGGGGSSSSTAAEPEWLFSINLLYLLLAPLLLRELPAMMATLDPLIDYLFDGPSSWLAFPGWCAELWHLFNQEKRMIVSRRKSADALDVRGGDVGKVGLDGLPRRKTW